jgi:hypothetical protein
MAAGEIRRPEGRIPFLPSKTAAGSRVGQIIHGDFKHAWSNGGTVSTGSASRWSNIPSTEVNVIETTSSVGMATSLDQSHAIAYINEYPLTQLRGWKHGASTQ